MTVEIEHVVAVRLTPTGEQAPAPVPEAHGIKEQPDPRTSDTLVGCKVHGFQRRERPLHQDNLGAGDVAGAPLSVAARVRGQMRPFIGPTVVEACVGGAAPDFFVLEVGH